MNIWNSNPPLKCRGNCVNLQLKDVSLSLNCGMRKFMGGFLIGSTFGNSSRRALDLVTDKNLS